MLRRLLPLLAGIALVAGCARALGAGETGPAPASERGTSSVALTREPEAPAAARVLVTVATPPPPRATPVLTGTQPPLPELEVVSYTARVERGGRATFAAQATPRTACTLAYTTPSGVRSEARGLGAAMSDAEGHVEWSWLIAPASAAGAGTLRLTCGPHERTAEIVVVP